MMTHIIISTQHATDRWFDWSTTIYHQPAAHSSIAHHRDRSQGKDRQAELASLLDLLAMSEHIASYPPMGAEMRT
eukprot:scaffold131076_cov26-Prasinocladus_malaysianus.AAC.1